MLDLPLAGEQLLMLRQDQRSSAPQEERSDSAAQARACAEYRMNTRVFIGARKKICGKESHMLHANCGSQVRTGRRQSMPSNSIDRCARVRETVPFACGHTKRPRSSRFANKHKPSPSHQSTLIRSPRRPRNTNTCPENGLCPASSAPTHSAR